MSQFIDQTETQRQAMEMARNKFCADVAILFNMLDQVQDRTIQSVNVGRELGLTLQGLCGHKQINLAFYQNLMGALPEKVAARVTFEDAKSFVHLANHLPEPVKTLDEARRYVQPLFEAGGFLAIAERSGPQKSHDVPLVTFFFNTLAKAKVCLEERAKEIEKCDDDEKESLRTEVERHEKWLGELKSKLN